MNPQLKLFLANRRLAYKRIFLGHGIDTDDVLRDLARFCRAHASTFNPDARVAAQLDGRREVWTRIQHHLQLTDDELWDLYGKYHLQGRE